MFIFTRLALPLLLGGSCGFAAIITQSSTCSAGYQGNVVATLPSTVSCSLSVANSTSNASSSLSYLISGNTITITSSAGVYAQDSGPGPNLAQSVASASASSSIRLLIGSAFGSTGYFTASTNEGYLSGGNAAALFNVLGVGGSVFVQCGGGPTPCYSLQPAYSVNFASPLLLDIEQFAAASDSGAVGGIGFVSGTTVLTFFTTNSTPLQISEVPEPSSFALLGGIGLPLLIFFRRR